MKKIGLVSLSKWQRTGGRNKISTSEGLPQDYKGPIVRFADEAHQIRPLLLMFHRQDEIMQKKMHEKLNRFLARTE